MKPRFRRHQWMGLILLSVALGWGGTHFVKIDMHLYRMMIRHRDLLAATASDSLTSKNMESYLYSINSKLSVLEHSDNDEQRNTIILSNFNEKLSSFPGIITQEVVPQEPETINNAELFTLNIKCRGSYEELARFIDVLEKAPHAFFIKSVTLKSNAKNKMIIQSQLVLQQFFQE